MATEVLGAALDAGEEQNEEEKYEDVDGSDVLEGEARETVEVRSDAHVKGEVGIEEGKELKVFVVGTAGEDHHGCLRKMCERRK